jgi:hypothetical protein
MFVLKELVSHDKNVGTQMAGTLNEAAFSMLSGGYESISV